jgi:hypothetical protein
MLINHYAQNMKDHLNVKSQIWGMILEVSF